MFGGLEIFGEIFCEVRTWWWFFIRKQKKKMNMRTGFDPVASPLTADQRRTMQRLMMVFAKQAFQHAAHYAKAADRSSVTRKDVLLGMKVAALPTPTYTFWGQEDLHQQLAEMEQALLEEDSDSEEEEEAVEVEWTAAPSSHSALVKRMNEVEEQWEQWEPTDAMGRCFKRTLH